MQQEQHASRLRDRAAECRRLAERTGQLDYLRLADAYETLADREGVAASLFAFGRLADKEAPA